MQPLAFGLIICQKLSPVIRSPGDLVKNTQTFWHNFEETMMQVLVFGFNNQLYTKYGCCQCSTATYAQ